MRASAVGRESPAEVPSRGRGQGGGRGDQGGIADLTVALGCAPNLGLSKEPPVSMKVGPLRDQKGVNGRIESRFTWTGITKLRLSDEGYLKNILGAFAFANARRALGESLFLMNPRRTLSGF